MDFNISSLTPELAQQYLAAPVFAFDIETDTENYHWGKTKDRGVSYPTDMTMISFAADNLPTLVLKAVPEWIDYTAEVMNLETATVDEIPHTRMQWNFTEAEVNFIKAIFSREIYTAIAHNLVFDARQIFGKFKLGIPKQATFWDTQAIQLTGGWGVDVPSDDEEDDDGDEVEEAENQSLSLINLSRHLFDPDLIEWWASLKPLRKLFTKYLLNEKQRHKSNITEQDLINYSAMDSIAALKLYHWQNKQEFYPAVKETEKGYEWDSLQELIAYDLNYTKLCVEMAAVGMRLNLPYLKAERLKYLAMWVKSLEHFALTPETSHLFGNKIWKCNYIMGQIPEPSPEDIIAFKLKTKTGAWSFNKGAMNYYISNYPQLFDYRKHVDLETKLRRIDEFIRHSEYDGRIHSTISRLAVTGRNTSGAPNVQNLALKYKVKPYEGIPALDVGYFLPEEGNVLVSLDCSNAENWMGAMYGRDSNQALACSKSDFHTEMASAAYFPEEWALADAARKKTLRDLGKTITFGTAYGMGVSKLALSLHITVEEAKRFLANKDRAFPQVAQSKEQWGQFAVQNGYCILWTGRRVRMRKRDGKYKGYTAWNSLAQGGVGEMIVRGMLRVQALLCDFPGARVVSQVHDEIVVELPPTAYPSAILGIIEALATVVPDVWNNRTTPHCRWLFDLCNRTNAKKWGYIPGKEYPLPLGEYVNRWGVHRYEEGQSECPVWINQWGYGEQAITAETGISFDHSESKEQKEETPTDRSAAAIEPFNWAALEIALKESLSTLGAFIYEDKLFDYATGMEIRRSLCHKGQDGSYLTITKAYDTLTTVMKEYEQWMNNGGRCS